MRIAMNIVAGLFFLLGAVWLSAGNQCASPRRGCSGHRFISTSQSAAKAPRQRKP